eukprot:TRINITY_DN7057_c0_g1_i1.p1 TRINITY_DN7057_c0_g1~~TRINITY_DN7057_c0_g1_i1.p1  ORF type:complete len:185 (+),score=93.74 TRINITY_DN7057_c0_g1_i1:56-610(+)
MTDKYNEEWQANLYNSLKSGGPKGRRGGLGFGGGAATDVDEWDQSGAEPRAAPADAHYKFAPGPKKPPAPPGAKKGFISFHKAGDGPPPEPEPEESKQRVVFDSDESSVSSSEEKKLKKKEKKKKDKKEKKEKKEKRKEKKKKEKKHKKEKKEKKKDKKKRKREERDDNDSDEEQHETKKHKTE